MKIIEYISSGILENYVLGFTSKEETIEVEQYASLYPEVKNEIAAIQTALNDFAKAESKTPPPFLKQQIWNTIESEIATEKPADNIAPLKIEPTLNNIVALKNWMKYAIAASILFLIGSALLNIVQYKNNRNSLAAIDSLKQKNEVISAVLNKQEATLQNLSIGLNFASASTTQAIALNGVGDFKDALATIYFSKQSNEVYLRVNHLPLPANNKQYQLWAIVDGKPVDAGVFVFAENEIAFQKMKNFASAQAFAITLEQLGGSPSPTLSAMYVMGKVS
jgi:anti-sigma-K factor RskA